MTTATHPPLLRLPGFHHIQTGGGCTALLADYGDGREVLVTAHEDPVAPSADEVSFEVGYYLQSATEWIVRVDGPSVLRALVERWEKERTPRVEDIDRVATDLIARAFSRRLREAVGERWDDLLAAHRTDGPDQCASHDFVDANVLMAEALSEVYGREIDVSDEDDIERWEAAWEQAKARDFDFSDDGRALIVEGEHTTLADFLWWNDGISLAEIRAIRALEPGESVTLGGGAFASFEVRRPHPLRLPEAEAVDTKGRPSDHYLILYLVPGAETDNGHPEIRVHESVGIPLTMPEEAFLGRMASVLVVPPDTVGESVVRALEALQDTLLEIEAGYLGSEEDRGALRGRWSKARYTERLFRATHDVELERYDERS